MKRLLKSKWTGVVLVVVALASLAAWKFWPSSPQELSLSQLVVKTEQGKVESAEIKPDDSLIVVQLVGSKSYETTYAGGFEGDLIKILQKENVDYKVTRQSTAWAALAAFGPLILILVFYLFMMSRMNGGSNGAMSFLFGKQDFSAERPTERFNDVKGADEAIEDMRPTIEALRDPLNYQGPPISQGLVFYGSTGTGKTLLAKASSGEADVPFYYLSGSQLTSMFVNHSARMIGNFFKNVKKDLAKKKQKSAVIFIDEIDGLAPSRKTGGAADQERTTTVTQLLHDIGTLFQEYPFVVVIAATNHIDAIDDALLRPGRLGKHVPMPNPDVRARTNILELNSAKLKFAEGVTLSTIAEMTDGMSGAKVKEVMLEAQRVAYMDDGRTELSMADLRSAVIRVGMGIPRKSAKVHAADREIVGVHESGHTLAAIVSKYCMFQHVTVLPIGESGGSTWSTGSDRKMSTEPMVMDRLVMLLAGLAAEELLNPNGETSSGAAHDLHKATEIAIQVVCQTSLGGITQSIDVKHWMEHPLASLINEAVDEMLRDARRAANTLMTENRAFLEALIAKLRNVDGLDREEVLDLYREMEEAV